MNRTQNNNGRIGASSQSPTGQTPVYGGKPRPRPAPQARPQGQSGRAANPSAPAAGSPPVKRPADRTASSSPAIQSKQYRFYTTSRLERVEAKKRQSIARGAELEARQRAGARGQVSGQSGTQQPRQQYLKGRVTSTGTPAAYHERGRVTTTGLPSGRVISTGAAPRSSSRVYTADTDVRSSIMTSAMKAVIYIVFLLVCVSFLSYYAIVWANDVFAFVKPEDDIAVTIPEYSTSDDIADILGERGVIKYPSIFKLYTKLRHKDQYEFVPGDYVVRPSQNYDQLIDTFRNIVTYERVEVTLTLAEGMTVDDMISAFVKAGIGTREGFIEEIQHGDFSDYWFIQSLEAGGINPNRKYRLEGYLYPDTYRFYQDSSEHTVLTKLLDNFEIKVDMRYKEAADSIGKTMDQVIILASMIESEAKFVPEYTTISSVFHNRLDHPDYETKGFMQSDATIQYILPEHKSTLTHEDTLIDDPYNTYMYKGLPPGPICNPTLNAIDAALYPAWTNYYYFVAEKSGYSLFAITAAEHEKNVAAVREQYAGN